MLWTGPGCAGNDYRIRALGQNRCIGDQVVQRVGQGRRFEGYDDAGDDEGGTQERSEEAPSGGGPAAGAGGPAAGAGGPAHEFDGHGFHARQSLGHSSGPLGGAAQS